MDTDLRKIHWLQWFGLVLGPVSCCLCLAWLPTEFPTHSQTGSGDAGDSQLGVVPFLWAGRATLSVMVWMGVWWLTEAIHISGTALLPMVLFPLMGIASMDEACSPYADPLVYLYFGGFVLALSMERWGLGKRIALMTLSIIGTSATRMIAGFTLVTAVLSAFVSNTATTAMMLPIALSVVALLSHQLRSDDPHKTGEQQAELVKQFATCLLLSIAYSASIGGVMTIIGTPTNTFLIGFIRNDIALPYRQDISFVGWLRIGVPFALIFLPIMFIVLTRFLFPIRSIEIQGGKQLIKRELQQLGKVQVGEWNTLAIFGTVVGLWLFRPLLNRWQFSWADSSYYPFSNLTDAGIAMTGAMLLFLIPVNFSRREFTMDWQTAERMPWGILLLFGGGLSLARAVQTNGVAEFIGSLTGAFGNISPMLLILMVTTAIVFLTELTSNAATTASLVPVLAALAPGLGIHPYLLIVPATIAASCAFMLPVATPPNAIVFGSGAITVPQMVRAGFTLNLTAIALVTCLTILLIKPLLGL